MQTGKKRPSHPALPLLCGAAILTGLILVAGCTGAGSESRLIGTEWSLKGYDQNGTIMAVLARTDVTLVFGKDGQIAGLAGCNHYFSPYEVKGTTITIGQAGSTMMYCGQPGVMEQESAYLTLLNKAATFTLAGDQLNLYDVKGTKILSFATITPPKPEPLAGTNWSLESVHNVNTVSSVISDTSVTAVFGDEGSVSGSAGCNRYFARYNLTGTSLVMSDIGSTKMACNLPGVMNQETTYLDLLRTIRSYSIEGSRLALLDNLGSTVLTFRADA